MSRYSITLLTCVSVACSEAPRDEVASAGLRPNVRGAEIRVIADSGANDPAPRVTPESPLHLVIDDCRDFVLFHVPDTFVNPDSGIVVLNWQERSDRQRSLTILAKSAPCASHAGVKRLLDTR